jgi:hypothetical protein
MTDGPPSRSGPWKVVRIPDGTDNSRSYSDPYYYTDASANAGLNYVTHFWQGLLRGC